MKVIYQKKIYHVLDSSFIGNSSLYKLESSFSGGSPFPAKKDDCVPVYWSKSLQRFVTIPEN